MKNSNFITIQGWMVNELGLSGNELLLYSLIYGFSQDTVSGFNLSLSYTTSWMNVSKQTVISTLKKLLEKNLIVKTETKENGVKVCKYMAVNNFEGGSQKSLPPPSQESLPHNNKDIIYNNIIKEHPNMKDAICRWLEYKKERKESYTKTGLVDCIEKLEKLSNGNPDLAMAIVKQSTSNGWAGLFPLKDNQKAQPQKKEPTVLIADGKFFIDDSMQEYADIVKTMTDYDVERCWKWIHDNFYGQEKPISWVRERLQQFRKGE